MGLVTTPSQNVSAIGPVLALWLRTRPGRVTFLSSHTIDPHPLQEYYLFIYFIWMHKLLEHLNSKRASTVTELLYHNLFQIHLEIR